MQKDLLSYFGKANSSQNQKIQSTPSAKLLETPLIEEDKSKHLTKTCPKPNLESKTAIKDRENKFEDSDYDLPDFIRKENIRDANKRRPDDPDYDASTLYIPPSQKFTPAMTQY